jgi:hypothetical protein
MTPQEALQIVDQAVAAAPLSRQHHTTVIQALQVLQAAIEPAAVTHADSPA